MTCYLRLSQTDFVNFKFSNFVKIGNMLYFVNKIYDFNVESNGTTKVDLISVQDINGYKS